MQKVVKQMGNLDLIGIEDMEDLELEWVLVELCSLQLFINLFKLNYKLSFLSFVCVFYRGFLCFTISNRSFCYMSDVRVLSFL